jgi:NTP pyrophosphatase (non-canonical NTP hydrolase)
MNAIKDILNNRVTKYSIWNNAKIINPSKKQRYFFESLCLFMLANQQLNSEKNKSKPKLEELHPLDLIEMCFEELTELHREFESEQEIDFERVLEEIGDICGVLSGIVAWVKKEKKGG